MNKKAVEMNVNTIIVVILAILVLVILALYFTGGMTNLWTKIMPQVVPFEQTDVENARSACVLLCSAQAKTSFCEREFDVRIKDSTETKRLKCLDAPINAQKEQECKNVGYTDATICTS